METKTLQDYMAMEESAPYELINGSMVNEPAPSVYHQTMVVIIVNQIYNHIQKGKKGIALVSPIDIILDNHNVLQPDLLYIAEENKNIIKNGRIYGAPDVVFEILSPNNSKQDKVEKKEIYEKFGVKEYWIIDQKDKSAVGYENSEKGFMEIFRGKYSFFSKILELEISLRY